MCEATTAGKFLFKLSFFGNGASTGEEVLFNMIIGSGECFPVGTNSVLRLKFKDFKYYVLYFSSQGQHHLTDQSKHLT